MPNIQNNSNIFDEKQKRDYVPIPPPILGNGQQGAPLAQQGSNPFEMLMQYLQSMNPPVAGDVNQINKRRDVIERPGNPLTML